MVSRPAVSYIDLTSGIYISMIHTKKTKKISEMIRMHTIQNILN